MNQKKEIIDLYRKKNVVKTFDEERNEFSYQRYKHKIEANLLKKALSYLTKNKQKIRVLDVACGTGRMLPVTLEECDEYYGVDTSKEMIKYLKQKAKKVGKGKKVHLVIGDATKMPFEKESFDLVFSYHLLWHLPQKEQKRIIKEMTRVTKKGGFIIFDILNKKFIYEKIKNFFRIEKLSDIYKMNPEEVIFLIRGRDYKIEKLCDAPINNSWLYKSFNLINNSRKILPINFYHMLYFTVRK